MFRDLQVELYRMKLIYREEFVDGNMHGFIMGFAAALLTALQVTPWLIGFLLPLVIPVLRVKQHWSDQYALKQWQAKFVGSLIVAYPLFLTLTLIANIWRGVLPGLSLLS